VQWVGKITLACPSGRVVRKLTGSGPGDVISRSTRFKLPGCETQKIEIVKRGVGAGLPDKLWREAPDLGGDSPLMAGAYRHVASYSKAKRRKKRRR
jgi:hypothetical protein